MKEQHIEGIVDVIPTYCSLLVNYDPLVISYKDLKKRLEGLVKVDVRSGEGKKTIVEIPVCYGGEYGPDIANIAEHAGLTEEEVIQIHSSKDYLIYMLGFLPGFTYLGGLDERIHTPRLASPRIKIRAGSVGIGGSQTGIYPLDSPGGWQLMGMTPVKTYDPNREVPILVEAGQYIRFIPIDEAEYLRIKDLVDRGEYQCVIREEV
jgi:KipI family sensor histidine kinase inhibitor